MTNISTHIVSCRWSIKINPPQQTNAQSSLHYVLFNFFLLVLTQWSLFYSLLAFSLWRHRFQEKIKINIFQDWLKMQMLSFGTMTWCKIDSKCFLMILLKESDESKSPTHRIWTFYLQLLGFLSLSHLLPCKVHCL